ncbi:MobB family relaxase [Flagellimonas sp. CMM7]|uniref:MobB family relaxase n=1 Tax=Flagellimonas sp. CMM7 TaxID=2654676 RepID=UPI0013D146B6|nr:MobB family relaxase [Flagellimonas sp. CMM7]UII81089.1 DUF5712 family protein [Flagellimonas sp. CMM7]
MYITITAQKIGRGFETYNSSVRDYVAYLEKENQDLESDWQETFFDQNENAIAPERVISEIDGNTAKLKKRESKFYSIVVSPSQQELKHIGNDPEVLRRYTREIMKDYAASFYRDRKVTVDDIKYYAKIEHERTFRGFEKKVLENTPYRKQIAKLQNDLAKVERGELQINPRAIQKEIERLTKEAPYKVNGKMVVEGMKKEGTQSHIHIIVSRKDVTNTYSLSPGTKFKESETILNGKKVKQGFHRDGFYQSAEKTFDRMFSYERNYVERYNTKKLYRQNPKKFMALLMGLPSNEKQSALKLLHKGGIHIPNIPTNKVQLAYKVIMKLKQGVERAIRSGAIEI